MKCFGCLVFLSCIFYLDAIKFDNAKSDILPSKETCGRQSCEAYPWMVFIPLQSRSNNPNANIRCAGALISKRYVITSKSCLQFVLTKVHIGQLDTTKNVTCENNPVLKIDIEGREIDESLDVVLLRLAEDVKFANDVQPICLPFEDFKKVEAGAEVFTSGWGLAPFPGKEFTGKNSNVMKKVKQTMISNEDCKQSGVIKDASDNKVVCVQRQKDNTDSACSGDEGSPIMHNGEGQWVLQGILNSVFDTNDEPCSIKNPARGPRITDEVLQWIVEKVRV